MATSSPLQSPLADPAPPSIKNKQTSALERMIALHEGHSAKSALADDSAPEELSWKVLVYDKRGRDIISPLLTVNKLREHGVTLHLQLGADRQPIPEVPAVYFIEPTAESVDRVGKDMAAQLYERYYICFTSAVPRDLLEKLANAAVDANVSHLVGGVHDEYVDFLSLEDRLFTLNYPDVYRVINSAADEVVLSSMAKLVSGLFSVLATLGDVPIIRFSPRGAAERVAESLEKQIRSHINGMRSNNVFDDHQQTPGPRPLLILLDRDMDLSTMLHHTWLYQSLLSDVLEMQNNKVSIEELGSNKKKVYEIDALDGFMGENAGLPFPQVAENVEVQLKKYKDEFSRISALSGGHDDSLNTDHLRSAVSALPELNARKRVLDIHMQLASALLDKIKKRNLDAFVALEESISKQNIASIVEVLSSPTRGTPEDKIRLAILFLLSQIDEVTDAHFNEIQNALTAGQCSVSSLAYINHKRAMLRQTAKMQTGNASTSRAAASDLFGKWGSQFSDSLMGGVMDNAVQMLKTGVSSLANILPSNSATPVTRVVEAILEGKSSAEIDAYGYIDPRTSKQGASQAPQASKTRPSYGEVIVFMVGGGNYPEYQNLQAYARKGLVPKNITYGASDLVNPAQFVKVLEELGKAK